MIDRKLLLLTVFAWLFCRTVNAQQLSGTENYPSFFAEAYNQYSNLPKGLLESVAYSASRMNNLGAQATSDQTDCMSMPQRFGLFGLIENGKGYFRNNLQTICARSGISAEQFKKDVRLQILTMAKFLSQEAAKQQLNASSSLENFSPILEKLSEIPEDGNPINAYAHALYTYEVYDHLQKGFSTSSIKVFPRPLHLEKVYPAKTLQMLKAPGVTIHYDQSNISAGNIFTPIAATSPANNTGSNTTARANSTDAVAAVQSTDYPPALWDQASTSNFTVGRGGYVPTNVVIHTCEGSYAGTISWFNNASAQVSAHYVVRSSDGQITQMVLEKDKAWHVLNHNYYTIGIEHEGYVASGNTWYTDAMYQSSAALVRDICSSWTIDGSTCFRGPATSGTNFLPVEVRIKGHQHYSGNTHTDPGIYWNWEKYANLISPPTAATIISFSVLDQSTQTAVASTSVTVTKPNGTTSTLTTNASGKLVFGADSGRYSFSFTKSGYTTLSTYFTGGVTDSIAATINLDPSASARVAAASAAPANTAINNMLLTGYVRDAVQNTALGDVQVKAGAYTATTDSRGYYALSVPATLIKPGQTPDAIAIRVSKTGYITHTIKNFHVIPDEYMVPVALSPTAAAGNGRLGEQEETETYSNGLFDVTNKETSVAGNASLTNARTTATAAAAATTVPSSIRVVTSCACSTCTNVQVQVMSLEAYVQTGLDDEWYSSWNAASLQAGAIAYRSRGAWYVANPVSPNYDLSGAACHQTWQSDRATSVKNAAVATAGIVLLKDGAIYKADYCAESNNSGCGDGYSGTGTDGPCISDARCAGRTKSGSGLGMCQWGSSFWGTDQTYTWILNHYYNPAGVTISSATAAAAATATASNTGAVQVSPNPVTGSNITVDYTLTDASQPASILVTDSYGNISRQQSVVLQQGLNHFSIPVGNLKAGVYSVTIRLHATGKSKSSKIVVVK